MWRRISWYWVLLHLAALSVEDLHSGFVSVYVTGILGISGIVSALFMGRTLNVLPGIGFLVIGYLSGEKIGYGDGYVILALGTWLDMRELLDVAGTGILYAAGAALVTGKKEMPLVPFLTAAYILRG